MKKRNEIMWAIGGKYGWYCGTWMARKEAIESHCSAKGKTWGQCKANGDYVAKVVLKAVNPPRQ